MSDSLTPGEPSPEELRLPEELAAFEALLAARPLAAVGIDRDELMYRAGWAACQAEALQPRALAEGRLAVPTASARAQGYPPAESGTKGTRRTVWWSAVSAALAASVAVAVTWAWHDSQVHRQPDDSGGGTPRLAAVEEEAPAAELVSDGDRPARNEFPMNPFNRLLESNGRGGEGLTLAGPWFAMQRRQATTGRRDGVEEVAINGEAPYVAPKTARELREELLPHESAPPASLWPWQLRSNGESI